VLELIEETPRTKSIILELPEWPGHRAGQHVDVRLTSEDGYQAERSYSIASAPEDEEVVLTVDRLPDGEVSPYLTDVLRPGDTLELRGPIGDYFVWEEERGGPLLLLAGGSGVVPLHAMLRHHQAVKSTVPARLLYSSRSLPEVIYHDELKQLNEVEEIDVRFTLTRTQPDWWQGYSRRVDRALLQEISWPVDARARVYVCGPNGFVEGVANTLVELGHEPFLIRTERFGPTGG
jgi:ferredoxin-NADP reductase